MTINGNAMYFFFTSNWNRKTSHKYRKWWEKNNLINLNKKCVQKNIGKWWKKDNHLNIFRIRKLLTIDQNKKKIVRVAAAAADSVAAILVALTRRFEMWIWIWQSVCSCCVQCASVRPTLQNANALLAIKGYIQN